MFAGVADGDEVAVRDLSGVDGFAVAEGCTLGDDLAVGVAIGVGLGLADELDLFAAAELSGARFEFASVADCFSAVLLFAEFFAAGLFELVDGLIRLLVSGPRIPLVTLGIVAPVRLDATVGGPPPGTDTTTSNLFARCSTWAVAPGCKRNERIVLLPLFCALTSTKPRPRTASARGTSAAGIFT